MSHIPADDFKLSASRALTWRQSLAEAARKDPAMFAQYVIRDERTSKGIRLAPMHKIWHELFSKYDRLVLWSAVSAGKTTMISIGRVLWEIGNDPTIRILVLSNTHGQAVKIINTIATYIQHSPEYKEVFPEIKPSDREEPWKPLSGQLTVARPTMSKDPTVTAAGVRGNILGARYDLIIIDDVLDHENTRTVDQRKGVLEWLQSTAQTRLTKNSRFWVIGTAWHPDDVLHHYAKLFCADGVQRAFRYPVLDEEGQPRWPEVWPMERIERQRKELSPAEFARTMLCEARDDTSSRFKRDWIDVALSRGREKTMAFALRQVPPGCKTYTGVDLAVQRHSAADMTVLLTIIVHPNGDREILDIQAGRWAGPDIVEKVIDAHHRFQSIVIIENNSAQDFLLQFTRNVSSVPIKPFTTGRNKADPAFGVESLAAEMANGKWIFPCKGGISADLNSLIQELLYYDPSTHTGDKVMAMWFAREGARLGAVQAQYARVDIMSR